MLLTEEEAKKRTCCGPPGGWMCESGVFPYCSGSECMAWRWYDDGSDDKPRRGFCGLAGRPEVS